MLDGEAPLRDASLLVRLLVRVEDEIDRGVTDGVGRDSPPFAIQGSHELDVRLGFHGLKPEELSALAPGLLVRLAHEAALETSVDSELDPGDPEPLVSGVGRDSESRDLGLVADSQQNADPDGKWPSFPELLEVAVKGGSGASVADAGEPDLVEAAKLAFDRREPLLGRNLGRWRQAHEALGRVDELAVQTAVRRSVRRSRPEEPSPILRFPTRESAALFRMYS